MIEQLWLFHCGYALMPESAMFGDASSLSLRRLPMMAAVAFHPVRGPILIDAPFGHEGPHNVGALWGTIMRNTFQTFKDEWSIIPRIEQLGIRPSEIHHILMTHLHFDHTGGMKALGHATFHINQREWNWANGLLSFDALAAGVAVSDFRALHARTELFSLPDYFERDAEGHDLFGDGSVVALSMPGHSPGHTGYRFKLADGRSATFMGDAVFQLAHIRGEPRSSRREGVDERSEETTGRRAAEPMSQRSSRREGVDERSEETTGRRAAEPIIKRALGFFPKLVAGDFRMVQYTQGELERYVEERPDEVLICSHDLELGERCMAGPIKL